jgi:hypothetical protein
MLTAKSLRRSLVKFLIVVVTTVVLSLNAHANGSITVHPSDASGIAEQAEENWEALSDAFANHSVVELAPGTFYLARSVVTWDPDVRISGAVSGDTILRTAPGFEVVQAGIGAFQTADVLSFPYSDGYDGTLEVRNITFVVDQPAQPYEVYQWALGQNIEVTEIKGISVINGELDYGGNPGEHPPVSFDMTFENLAFLGERGGDYLSYWRGFPFGQPNSIGHGIIVWGPANGTVVARNIVTDYASLGVMLELVGESSATVDGCEFTGTAHFYGALYLSSITDVTVTSNYMDGMLFAANVSGSIQDNVLSNGRGRLGAVYLNGVRDSFISGNHIEQFTVYQWFRAGIYLWNSQFNDVTDNTFVDVLGDGLGTAAIRARGGSSGNEFTLNTYTHSGLPGWNESNGYSGPGAVLLDPGTTSNLVKENKFPPMVGPAICQMILDLGDGNTVLNSTHCEHVSW